MSDSDGAVNHGPFRNPDGNLSVKKVLGTFGTLMVFGIGIFGIIKDPSTATILGVMERLSWFSGALLGLKIASGGVHALANRGNK